MRLACSAAGPAAAGLALIFGLAGSAEAAAIRRRGDGLSDALLSKVKANLADNANDTWVAGTQAEALLELEYPSRAVFASGALVATSPRPYTVESIIATWYAKLPSDATQFAEVSGGAAGDPASLGVPWIVAEASAGSDTQAYADIVKSEINYLTKSVPRSSSGAISTRPPDETVQLWADFTYMVPPFLAYYGASQNNTAYIDLAYSQIKLYRDALLDEETGLWQHIVLGDWQSTSLWSPGNGWAAAGITRVLATILYSNYAADYTNETTNLANWAEDIVTAAFAEIRSDDLLPNIFGVSSGSTFSDGGASALLASVAYRLASLGYISSNGSLIETAEQIRAAVEDSIGSDGWLSPVSDPLTFTDEGSESPEAQAFVLLLEAAFADWKA